MFQALNVFSCEENLKHIHGIIEERERKYKIIKKEEQDRKQMTQKKSKEA